MNRSTCRVQSHGRRACVLALAGGLAGLTGCGGGGGGGGGSAGEGSNSVAVGGDTAPAQSGGLTPPKSGAFGGGQGKILYVEAASTAKRVKEFDLATRQIRSVVSLDRDNAFWGYRGGLSRASNGTFALIERNDALLSEIATIHVHRDDGSLVRSFSLPDDGMTRVAISPSGRHVVHTWVDTRNATSRWTSDNYFFAVTLDVETGERKEFVLLDGGQSPSNKSGLSLSASPVWQSDSVLYVLFRGGYARVDVTSGKVTPVLDEQMPSPSAVAVSPGRDEVWFQREKGNPYGPTIWSLSLVDGSLRQRTSRSKGGHQYAPAFSPDGQWLLLQEGHFLSPSVPVLWSVLSAVRLTPEPVDTEGLDIWLPDATNDIVQASGNMAWY